MNQANYAQTLINEVGESLYLLKTLTNQKTETMNDEFVDNLNTSKDLIDQIIRTYHNDKEQHPEKY